MNAQCQVARRALEDEGRLVDPGLAAHFAECRSCAAHAGLLQLLDGLEPGDGDEEAARRILLELPLTTWQLRRAASWAPLAGGGLLLAGGLLLLGGVPAGGTVASLPSGVYTFVSASVLDAIAAARGSVDAIRVLLTAAGSSSLVWLALSALAGSLGVRALLRHPVRGKE